MSTFRDRLDGRQGSIKGALMNQSVIAGIGTIYVGEILFQAQVHPEGRRQRSARIL